MKITDVYIQQERGTYTSPCGFAAHEGFRFMGPRVRIFEEKDLPSLPLTRHTLVHGWVRTVQAALRQIGAVVPAPIDYPDELRAHLATPVWRTTLAEVRAAWSEEATPVFVKPVEQKLFTGHTIERFSHLSETEPFPAETAVWAAGIAHFVTEYRVFVHEDRPRGIKHYRGDAWMLPDKGTVLQMIQDYAGAAPIAYGLDVGVLRSGRTCLVEVNDSYSLGTYGFDPLAYAEMLEDRWVQMTAGVP